MQPLGGVTGCMAGHRAAAGLAAGWGASVVPATQTNQGPHAPNPTQNASCLTELHVKMHTCGHTAQRGWPLSLRTPHAKLSLLQQMLLAAVGGVCRVDG